MTKIQCIYFLFSAQTEATIQTGRFERSQYLNCVVLWNHRQWQRGRWSNFSVVHGRPEFLVVPLSWRSQDSPNTRGHWTRSRGYGNDGDDDDDDDDEDDGDDDLYDADDCNYDGDDWDLEYLTREAMESKATWPQIERIFESAYWLITLQKASVQFWWTL